MVGDRRFLVGAGEGFGRSTQAFADINPQAGEVVLYEPDCLKLDDTYRRAFEPAINRRGEQSSLFRVANASGLVRARAQMGAVATTTTASFAPGSRVEVATKPHHR